ncbi:MAG: lamin tail domain-containing protein, partial [Candidatus Cloacimonadaceae bacterium]
MKLRSLIILLLVSLAAMLSAQATNLIISEYVEGTSYNKALEIFNGTGSPVDLSTVSLKKQTNGAGSFGNELVLSGTLADNDVYVIVNSTSSGTNLSGEAFVDLATTSQVVNFNGNDAVALYRNGVMIDLVGIVDQVDMWGAEVTWVRNSNVASPSTTFNMTEWTEYPQNTFSYLG